MSVEELAEELAVGPDDVRALVADMVDLHDDDLPDYVAAEVRSVFNPHCERTVPELYWPRVLSEGRS